MFIFLEQSDYQAAQDRSLTKSQQKAVRELHDRRKAIMRGVQQTSNETGLSRFILVTAHYKQYGYHITDCGSQNLAFRNLRHLKTDVIQSLLDRQIPLYKAVDDRYSDHYLIEKHLEYRAYRKQQYTLKKRLQMKLRRAGYTRNVM